MTCFVPDWEQFRWFDRFLPSARCMAVRRQVFDAAGGFPEHLTRTGEDTLFGLACRRVSARWVISKRARVVWDAPTKAAAVFDLARKYAVGDGESGFGDYHFTPADQPDPRTLRGMVAGSMNSPFVNDTGSQMISNAWNMARPIASRAI